MAKETILPVIFGIKSTSLSEDEIKFFQQYPAQGIILFSRNIESKEQLIALNKSIKALYEGRPNLPIFVDQEGGRVARIKPPIAQEEYPAAKYFAALYKQDKDKAILETFSNYKKIMQEALSLGIDSLCAPVCDLIYEGASDVIGDRSFGDNPQQVIDLAGAAIDAIAEAGGIPFVKHVPGHGRALVDSHYELPHVDASLEELAKTDFAPFKKLQAKEAWGMTAHIVYKEIDPDMPITLSAKGMKYIRENIFNGTIITDDVGMFALHGEIGVKKALLKRLDDMSKKEGDWLAEFTSKYGEVFAQKFDISPGQVTEAELKQIYEEKQAEIKEEFLSSLAHVSKLSIDYGCDYVLHCSGDLEEMQAIASALTN